uniref:PSI domain-containing protein n=1 Tax=Anopheles atroparvus TaxID=41427 RepID=A0AAG5DUW6_ANOAO
MARMNEFQRLSLCWLLLFNLLLCQYGGCEKALRKHLQSNVSTPGDTMDTPVVLPTPTQGANETYITESVGTSSTSRSVIPLNENKMSHVKLKLQNEYINGKKQQPLGIGSGNLSLDANYLLGFNGTGQRKDYTYDGSLVPAAGSNKMQAELTTLMQSSTLPAGEIATSTTESVKDNNEASTRDPISDAINIDTVERTEAELNSTLKEHNITKTFEDNHLYYKSTWSTDKTMSEEFWKKVISNLTINGLLSNSHRRATTMLLSFDFPFYGFPIRNITIASGGFLYTGDYVHSWLASTQYIAPLMANFDTALSNTSYVKYRDDGETFTVLWENVILQDRPKNGSFTFSVTLKMSGDIVFAYKKIPIDIQQIFDNPSTRHPVKIGLSDAYIIDKTIIRTKQKTIYEYHRVNFGQTDVQNGTIITLTALPTCFSFKDCDSCITHEGADFKCLWCPTINRCSTGTDRKRQDWMQKGCDKTTISEMAFCPAVGQKGNNYGSEPVESSTPENHSTSDDGQQATMNNKSSNSSPNGSGNRTVGNDISDDDSVNKVHTYHTDVHEASSSSDLFVSMMVIFGILFACACWLLYAYRNPHTKSGQLLIRYRPNKWSWRRGEARYTAATIHM